MFKNGGKAKYRGQTARRRAEKLALAESSTLKPLDSISVNQDKVEAVKRVIKNLFEDKPKTEEEIENTEEDRVEEVTYTESEAKEAPPEVQLKQAIEESTEDYVYEEEPELKDYSSEYMVNDAIEYPTLIDEEPEEIDEQPNGTVDDFEEVAGALNIYNAYYIELRGQSFIT